MSISSQKILDQAMQLPLLDRATLIEGLITSLDKPDSLIDTNWLKESESRIGAYHSGELAAVDIEEAFAELGRKV
jgi:putative addiction module component (TIGR02574 family)